MICEVDNVRSKLDIRRIKCELVKSVTLVAYNGS